MDDQLLLDQSENIPFDQYLERVEPAKLKGLIFFISEILLNERKKDIKEKSMKENHENISKQSSNIRN